MKRKGFAHNAAIMFVAMFLTKGLGALLKIPLGNILGGEGMGYFTTAYSIYTPILAFVCSGIPTIVTQVTARYASQDRGRELFQFRRSALLLGGGIGLAGTAVIYLISMPFAYYVANSPGSLPAILMIAPAVFGCSVTAVYRGYYEGLSDMLPTAVSQVIEAAVKAAIGVGASYYVYVRGTEYFGSVERALPYAAAAAILGVTISEYCGTFYIVRKVRKETAAERGQYGKPSFDELWGIMKEIMINALPVAAGAAASNLISFTDLLTVANCINLSYGIFSKSFSSVPALSEVLSAPPSDLGNFLYGSYSGMVLSVYMLTAAAAGLISRCSLPRLVCAAETENIRNMNDGILLMLKGTALIAVPLSLLIAALSKPILTLLYPMCTAEVSVSVLPLQILSIGGIISGLGGAVFTIFHAYGDFKMPVKITLYGGAVKFILNVLLLLIPQVNISGAALSTVLSNGFMTLYACRVLKKRFRVRLPLFSASLPAFLSGLAASVCVVSVFSVASERMNAVLGILFSLAVASFLYLFLMFLANSRELTEIFRSLRRRKSERYCEFPEGAGGKMLK